MEGAPALLREGARMAYDSSSATSRREIDVLRDITTMPGEANSRRSAPPPREGASITRSFCTSAATSSARPT